MPEQKILYDRKVIPKIAQRFGVTEATVRLALRFKTKGDRPDLIRKEAVQFYGCVLMKKKKL
jgi:predicted transcriptional regulator